MTVINYSSNANARTTRYDNSVSGLSALNVQDAIDEIVSNETNYDHHAGYYEVVSSLALVVSLYKQMHVFSSIKVDGTLTVEGQLVIF